MFLPNLHAPSAKLLKAGDDVSSFYVKRCIYLAFFGMTGELGILDQSLDSGTREDTTAAHRVNQNGDSSASQPLFSNLAANAIFDNGVDSRQHRNAQGAQNEARLPEV
jgi:hypothetical protein